MKRFLKFNTLLLLLLLESTMCWAQSLDEVLDCGLPVVVVNTVDGEEPTSEGIMHPDGNFIGASITNVVPKEARMQIYRGDTLWYDSGEYLEDESGIKIKHRGNTSAYYYDNKPFKLSLQKKANLIEAEQGDITDRRSKDWVLLNNSFSIKSHFIAQLEKMIGMEYAPRVEYVNVIINGDYRGIYILSENVKRDKECRIDVDKEDGYIIELDAYFWNEPFYIKSKLTSFLAWTLKYPKPEDLTEQQEADIRNDIERLETSIKTADYPEVIDVRSFARWILLHDLLSTSDPGGSNIFVARKNREPASLMCMPTGWDMESSMQYTDQWSKTHTEKGLFIYHLFANTLCKDFTETYLDEWERVKRAHVMERMAQMSSEFPSTAQGQGLKRSYPLHRERWGTPVYDVEKMSMEVCDWFTQREPNMERLTSELREATGIGDLQESGQYVETDYSDYQITHEYFTKNGTAVSASGGYDMTGYIPVKEGDVIVFSGDRSPGIPFMMGYTDEGGTEATVLLGNFDENDLEELQVRDREVIIPAGISYVRCSARNTSVPNWAGCNMTVIKRAPAKAEFSLQGDERPTAGTSLCVSSDNPPIPAQYTFQWTRGNALGTFDDSVLSTQSAYTITESDYEHWLRATVRDKAGNTIFTKDTWISKLPVLYIDTEGSLPITSKKDYLTADLRIQGNAEFEQQYVGMTEIRGRGNSSWASYPQKPYKLKLDKKTKLFGFPKSKHWALISNFNDKSCLRNYIASQLAKQLGILGMDMTWVDVVLNGEVKGCYMLSQHVRVDKNSVDIFDWEGEAEDVADALFLAVKEASALAETDKGLLEDAMVQNLSWVTDGKVTFKGKTYNLADYGLKKEYDITKGYLFEASQKTGPSHFLTPQNVNIEVSAPEYLSTNNAMMSYVENFWKDFEAEYCRVPTAEGKDFAKYADMESMVGVWLVNEIMGQLDQANSRLSFIGNDGKLHFGPAWDFDHSSAAISGTRQSAFFYTFPNWTIDAKFHDMMYYHEWFPDPFLCQMAYDAYWNVARPFIMDCTSEGGVFDEKKALLAEAGQTNDLLWGHYPVSNPNAILRSAAEDIEFLRTFLLDHIEWLDQQFQSVRTLIEAMNKVCTYPCDPDLIDGIQTLTSSPLKGGSPTEAQKVIKDKHLYIVRGDKTYTPDGKRAE